MLRILMYLVSSILLNYLVFKIPGGSASQLPSGMQAAFSTVLRLPYLVFVATDWHLSYAQRIRIYWSSCTAESLARLQVLTLEALVNSNVCTRMVTTLRQ